MEDPSMMSHTPTTHHPTRKRAAEACIECRSKKVRCDVISKPPCVRCRLDGIDCVVRAGDHRGAKSSATVTPPSVPRSSSAYNEPATAFSPADADYWLGLTPTPWPPSLPEVSLAGAGAASLLDDLQGPVGAVPSEQLQLPTPAGTTIEPAQVSAVLDQRAAPLGLCDLSHLMREDVDYLTSKGVFALPPKSVQDSLLRAFFLYIHPLLPVMAEDSFWSDYDHGLKHTSFLVYRAMLFSACPFLEDKTLRQWGEISITTAQEQLFRRASLLFDFDRTLNKLDLVRAALLLSFWSTNLRQQGHSRPGTYWLSVALSEARVIAARYRMCPQGFGKEGRTAKCLLWSCIIRETVLTLGYRGTNLIEPHLLDVPPLEPDDLDDPMSYSRVHEREQKRILAGMLLSFTKLVSLSNKFRPLRPSSSGARLAGHPGPDVLEHLIERERASMQMAAWRQRFLCEFRGVSEVPSSSDLYVPAYHQIMVMVVYESLLITMDQPCLMNLKTDPSLWTRVMTIALESSWERMKKAAVELNRLVLQLVDLGFKSFLPITICGVMINSGIIHAASRLFQSTGQHCEDFSISTSFDILEDLRSRFPAVGDAIEILRAAIRYAQQQRDLPCLAQAVPAAQVDPRSAKDGGFPGPVSEAAIVAKAMSFIDRAYFEPALPEWVPDQSLDHSDMTSLI